jgi:hypothetical protein
MVIAGGPLPGAVPRGYYAQLTRGHSADRIAQPGGIHAAHSSCVDVFAGRPRDHRTWRRAHGRRAIPWRRRPTVVEAGLAGFESIAGHGLFAPGGTPGEIVNRLNAEVNAIVKSPEAAERWTAMGIDRAEQTPDPFASWLACESTQWATLIKTHNIKAE